MIGVVGLGFVGLTTALGFAEKGIEVNAVEADGDKLSKILSGHVPFLEAGLEEALIKHLGKQFSPNRSYDVMVQRSSIILVCVGTPEKEGGKVDLSFIFKAVDQVMQSINDQEHRLILIKSTVPPGTVREIRKHLNERFESASNIVLGSNPEFLREGFALKDFIDPDRVVIGLENEVYWKSILEELYGKFCKEIYFTNPDTAEFVKYLSNTFLSTLISYSNEMSIVARTLGNIEIKKAFNLLHKDRRFFGSPAPITSYVFPGCGYGGYCLPKDTKAIVALSQEHGFIPDILNNNILVNEKIMDILLSGVCHTYPDKSTKVGILGLSFKPDSDDVRDSPAARCIRTLNSLGYGNIYAFDPVASNNFKENYKNLEVKYVKKLEEILTIVDTIIIVTAWKEFGSVPNLFNKKIFDFRYFLQ